MIGAPVPPFGPLDARLLIVGEAGGKEEGLRGQPFVGPSGWALRKRIRQAGLDDETDVRWANVIASQQGELPSAHGAMAALVRRHWDDLTPVLETAQHHRVILAVGRAALYRLTGYSGIAAEHGSVYDDIPGLEGKLVIPCLHPASIMRSKLESKWPLVEAAVWRACRYASGALVFDPTVMRPPFEHAGVDELIAGGALALASKGGALAIDTEFNPDTGQPFEIGLSWDGERVLHVALDDSAAMALVKGLLQNKSVLKVMHYMPADIGAMAQLGLHPHWPLWDTMVAQSVLWSDLPGGLAKTALFYLDHVRNWKNMRHDDPQYNAIDVALTWKVQQRQSALFEADQDLMRVFYDEAMPAALIYAALESRGLRVDYDQQRRTDTLLTREVDEQRARVQAFVGEMFAKRIDDARRVAVQNGLQLLGTAQQAEATIRGRCPKHPNYNGLVKPRGKADETCCCAALYTEAAGIRGARAAVNKTVKRSEALVTRWSKGFEPTNNEHVRWLLYDKDGLNLATQYNRRKVTANIDALRKLRAAKRVQDNPAIAQFITDVLGIRHSAKRISTFVWPSVDENRVAHPAYRVGTGTGRVAGGSDKDLASERKQSEMAYNAMNIPEDCRSIYVPHEAWTESSWFNAPASEDDDDDDTTEAEEEA